nr:GGDEF domain-containing protein [Aquabacterium terrae]
MLVASIAGAWIIGGRIARSTRALCLPALALGRGEAVTVGALPLKELDEVGSALTTTSTLLQQALHDAHHDSLTGLANRTMFEQFLRQRIVDSKRAGGDIALLYIDLDGFKAVNDRHGHHVGDDLLREAARRLRANVRLSDIAARLGGDEFAVMLHGTGAEGAVTVAQNLVGQLSQPYGLGSGVQSISASVGIAVYPQDASSAEQLLHRADEAMYRAKAQGRRRYAASNAS